MRQKFAILASAGLVFAGCSQDLTPTPPQIDDEVTTEIPPRNVENAVYNPLTDMWMIPQADPYTLENFQAAYDNLASGKSLQTLTRAEEAEFSEGEQLEPTHFALRIYPKTLQEQRRFEIMEDIDVTYSPFNYSTLTEEETAMLSNISTENAPSLEKSPYFVRHNAVSEDGVVDTTSVRLSVLYAVWPVEKTLPDEVEYTNDYEIYLPGETPQTRSGNADAILEAEALYIALGLEIEPNPVSTRADFRGFIKTTDNLSGLPNREVPMPRLRLKTKIGSSITSHTSGEDGSFELTAGSARTVVADWDFIYQEVQGNWTITNISKSGNTAPIIVTKKGVSMPISGGTLLLYSSSNKVNEIHRAVACYYERPKYYAPYTPSTYFPQYIHSKGLEIDALSVSGPDSNGSFTPFPYQGEFDRPTITIYNNEEAASVTIGTVFHELGHFAHYMESMRYSGGASRYIDTHQLLKESFASYLGWFGGEKYYESLGWTKPANSDLDITGQARQDWYKNLGVLDMPYDKTPYYSPLFVDLVDGYNQRIKRSTYPQDTISDSVTFGTTFLYHLSKGDTWESFKESFLKSATTNYGYNATDLNNYFADYDYWFTYFEPYWND